MHSTSPVLFRIQSPSSGSPWYAGGSVCLYIVLCVDDTIADPSKSLPVAKDTLRGYLNCF